MKFFLVISLFFILINASQSAVSVGLHKSPYHPGKCVIYGRVLSFGDSEPIPGICGKMYCGQNSYMVFYTCSTSVNNLQYFSKINGNYPDCCGYN